MAKSAICLTDADEQAIVGGYKVHLLEGDKPRLIDEWQEFPAVWDVARNMVDSRGGRGLFIFTGSHAPKPGTVKHSGAGRVGKILMSTMSLYESRESSGKVSLRDVISGEFMYAECPLMTIEFVANAITRGGWPGMVTGREKSHNNAMAFIDNAYEQMAAAERFDGDKIRALLRSLARHESQPVSDTTIARDIQHPGIAKRLSQETLNKYIGLFRRFYLIDPVSALEFNLRTSANVLGREKMMFCDPAIACALLGVKTGAALMRDSSTFGLMFESMCMRDLKIYARSFGASVRYYRDSLGNELDAVVQCDDGSWAGFEIKLSVDKIDQTAKQLLKLAAGIPADRQKPKALGIIVPIGGSAYKRTDGVYVIPITALKN